MKTYKFEIQVEELSTESNFIDNLMNEVKDEKKQLDYTYKVNKEVTIIHSDILKELRNNLNEKLMSLGVIFDSPRLDILSNSNHYRNPSVVSNSVNGWGYVIFISPKISSNRKRSKYTTYQVEDYKIKIVKNSSPCYTACQSDNAYTYNTIDELLGFMKPNLKVLAEKKLKN